LIIVHEFPEIFAVRFGNIDSLIIDNQLIAFNLFDFIQSDDVGTMHPHEIVFGQFFFEFSERHQSENRPLFCGKINLHIILQTFDVEDVFKIDFDLFIVGFRKEKIALLRRD